MIQGKLKSYEKELEIKQEKINSLTAELDGIKQILFSNDTDDIKQLRHQLRQANSSNMDLKRKVKSCEEKYQAQFNKRFNRIKAEFELKDLEYQETLNQIAKRNRQLSDRLNNDKGNTEDIRPDILSMRWVADKVTEAFGFKDVVIFSRNFVIFAESLYKGLVVLAYAYTFYCSANNYMDWLKNSWNKPMNKVYAISVCPNYAFLYDKVS